MGITTKDKLSFALSLGRHTRATMRQVEMLIRYGQTLWMLERDHSLKAIAKRERIRGKVTELMHED